MNRDIVRSFRTQITPLPPPSGDFEAKVVIVTGANSGLGKASAALFARFNAAKVILACRSVEKGEAVKQEILKTEKTVSELEVWHMDLSSYAGIKDFCDRADKLERLDVFIANAGLQSFDCQYYEGYERQTFVHVIAPIMMVLLLLPVMRRTFDRFQTIAHHVLVNSNGHMYTKFGPGKEKSILEAIKGDHDMRHRYYDSKLVQIFAGRELAERLQHGSRPSIILNLVDPGYCQSDLLRDKSWELPVRVIMGVASKVLARSPEMGARTYIHAAIAGPESHGVYLEDCQLSIPSPIVESDEGKVLQKRVWDELVAVLEQAIPGITKII